VIEDDAQNGADHVDGGEADLTAYKHVVPDVDLGEKNKATAGGAKLSEEFDLTKEDAVDDLLLNEVIWRSVRGPNSAMPPLPSSFRT
jgi:hypothetical protein